MAANVCPKCGKSVMPYGRFLRVAEPYKVSACGTCGAMLRRSPKIYLLLVAMCLVLAVIGVPLFLLLSQARTPAWISIVLGVILIAIWILMTNYLGWRLVGWLPAEGEKRT